MHILFEITYPNTQKKITFKLGTFANSCFVSISFGDTERTKETLYALTRRGILCTFNVQGRYLQKWVNLRMDKAFYITIKSSFVLCCGAPNKVKFLRGCLVSCVG